MPGQPMSMPGQPMYQQQPMGMPGQQMGYPQQQPQQSGMGFNAGQMMGQMAGAMAGMMAGMQAGMQAGMMGGMGGQFPPEGYICHIVPMNNQGVVVDVSGVASHNGAKIHMWGVTGAGNQKWRVHRRMDGSVSFHPLHAPHMALDMTGNGQTQCHIWQNDDNNANQSFFVEPNQMGQPNVVCLRSERNGMYLDCDLSIGGQQGSKVHTWNKTGAPNQAFMLRQTM
jgi:hypothetical protein